MMGKETERRKPRLMSKQMFWIHKPARKLSKNVVFVYKIEMVYLGLGKF